MQVGLFGEFNEASLIAGGARRGSGLGPGADRAATPPPAAAKSRYMVKGPANRNDEYYWLRDDTRKNPEMLAYLNAENAYADAMMAPLQAAAGRRCTRRSSAASSRTTACRSASAATGTTRASRPAQDYPILARSAGQHGGAGGDPARRQRDGQGPGLFQRRRLRRSARTTACSPGPRTRSAGASTRSASTTLPPARRSPTRSTMSSRTWSGPTTTARCSTSRTTRRRCSPCA